MASLVALSDDRDRLGPLLLHHLAMAVARVRTEGDCGDVVVAGSVGGLELACKMSEGAFVAHG